MFRFLFFFPLALLFILTGCGNSNVEKPQQMHLGSFDFDVPVGWTVSHSADTLFLDSVDVRIKVISGFRLKLSILNPFYAAKKLNPKNSPIVKMQDRSDVENFSCSYYLDSLPFLNQNIHFSVFRDSLLRKYICYPDSGNDFPSEFLAVHSPSGNSIRFQKIKGEKNHSEKFVFSSIKQNIRFNPDPKFPLLVEFSDHDTAFDNRTFKLDSCFSCDPIISTQGKILEVHSHAIMNTETAKELYGSISISNDSLFFKTYADDWRISFSKHANLFYQTPFSSRLLCDCLYAEPVYFKIRLPENSPQYKIIFVKDVNMESSRLNVLHP
jgi:hypothetical protein